jgi:hypothetical protein
MIWFFTRDSAQVDIEVRRLSEAGPFELVIDYPDGSEEVERFRSPKRLVKRTLAVQQRLLRQGWVPTGPGRHPYMRKAPRHARGARRLKTMPRLVWRFVQHQITRRIAATFGF